MKKKNNKILINILTRTSNRPIGFDNLRYSITNQTFKNVNHIVSYDNDNDLSYINKHDLKKVKVDRINEEKLNHPDGFTPAFYNLYCNELLDQVEEGWIMFIDDDVNIFHNKVLQEIVGQIKKNDDDTIFFWQSRYPNRVVIPSNEKIRNEKLEIYDIDSSCFLFHSKYKNKARWDGWKVSDYRFIKALSEIIPNKKWINQVYIQINNQGDLGGRNDIGNLSINRFIFHKTFFWNLIPKYHYQIFDLYLFKSDFFELLYIKVTTSLRYKKRIIIRYFKPNK
ncbi:hypothetical protein [uncultured Flavobacterium sp.]|uniref:hypothetical protein n=1 Tax=uncultured Flavobacterium sp. TaxID=165435 RepID=UPI00308141A8